jgi:hypothetical protein
MMNVDELKAKAAELKAKRPQGVFYDAILKRPKQDQSGLVLSFQEWGILLQAYREHADGTLWHTHNLGETGLTWEQLAEMLNDGAVILPALPSCL